MHNDVLLKELENVENPFIENTVERQIHAKACKLFGCIVEEPVFGIPSSHCIRCGKKTPYALSWDVEWKKPKFEYALDNEQRGVKNVDKEV